jgi:UDP-N-acetylmuramate dehydrogenase
MRFSTMYIKENTPLSDFSTFGIGGPARYLVEVKTVDEVSEAFAWARDLPVLVVGNGSNTLFSDDPFPGLVIVNRIGFCKIEGTLVEVGAGHSFSLLGIHTARKGLSGLEFASGIPATVGGAIFMNAGANGKETCECLHSVAYLLETGEVRQYLKSELEFGYRHSSFQSMKGCILSAVFLLSENPAARKAQLAIVERRIQTQPLKDKSVGCIFQNPSKEFSAGALIDQCGLKGHSVGGAKVSEIHANFIVNHNRATARDVIELIRQIREKVKEKTGILLEPEVRIR